MIKHVFFASSMNYITYYCPTLRMIICCLHKLYFDRLCVFVISFTKLLWKRTCECLLYMLWFSHNHYSKTERNTSVKICFVSWLAVPLSGYSDGDVNLAWSLTKSCMAQNIKYLKYNGLNLFVLMITFVIHTVCWRGYQGGAILVCSATGSVKQDIIYIYIYLHRVNVA